MLGKELLLPNQHEQSFQTGRTVMLARLVEVHVEINFHIEEVDCKQSMNLNKTGMLSTIMTVKWQLRQFHLGRLNHIW